MKIIRHPGLDPGSTAAHTSYLGILMIQ